MAIASAPYCHPRLAVVSTSAVPGRDHDGDINITQIYGIPRGARIDQTGAVMTIDGEAVELTTIEPFGPTPPLELTDQTAPPAPIEQPPERRLPVIEPGPDDGKVMRLDTFKSRRDDDDSGSGAA